MWLTGFLFKEGRRDNRLVDSVCIERHIVCAVHVINPELFVSLWEVVDADVWGGAGVQPACGSSEENAVQNRCPWPLGKGMRPSTA